MLSAFAPIFAVLLAARVLLGAVFGSFLNCAAWRIANGESVPSTHDFADEGDAKMILGGAGSRAADDYGVWCNYGNLYEDFNMAYTSGVLKDVIERENPGEWEKIPWALMESGDPRWVVDCYRRIAMREGIFSDLGLGTYRLYQKWGMDDASKNVAGKNFYDFVNGKNFNIGSEVEFSYNFAGYDGFKVRPCIGTKWVF